MAALQPIEWRRTGEHEVEASYHGFRLVATWYIWQIYDASGTRVCTGRPPSAGGRNWSRDGLLWLSQDACERAVMRRVMR